MLLWVLQAVVFWHGMEMIKKFINFAGPAVYVVMFMLAGYMVWRAGIKNIGINLGGVKYHGMDVIPVMITAISLVVSYFSGPMLNFGDFSRYGKSFRSVKRGNFWGLPVNFLAFSLVTGDGHHDGGDLAGVRSTDHRSGGNGRPYRSSDGGDSQRADVHHRDYRYHTWRTSCRRPSTSRTSCRS